MGAHGGKMTDRRLTYGRNAHKAVLSDCALVVGMASEGADLGPKKVAVALRAARRARLLDDDSTADRFESKPRPY